MIYLLYFFIIVGANTIGAVSGMGGGVLIKPMLDAVGFHTLIEITFYSSVAVFTMSFVSSYRQIKSGAKIDPKKASATAFGSLLGGTIGNIFLEYLNRTFQGTNHLQVMQILLTIAMLLFALWYANGKRVSYHVEQLLVYFLIGLLLGSSSTLLGIGGGPINVALLMLFFSLSIKSSAIYSLIIIFVSQAGKLTTMALTTGFSHFDHKFLLVIIPAAIVGGLLGAKLSGILSEKKVNLVYQLVLWSVIGLNVWNLFML